ncbi:AAA family ATPase [Agrococcus jejuensis]|uniref:Pilus assembly protein CpaE n=1 Tax=Agrococcus jejuensis TaxID=399736 RepID=A0A1G8E9M3_9MICO|nr:AAA family ATPase [Agrococcus jejuensis]SDH66593.1 pilus assembly protein CpaE [Agrococcus jejuensis]
MTAVLLVSDSPELHARVHDASGGTCIAVPAQPLPTDPRHLLALAAAPSQPEVLVVDATRSSREAIALAARIDVELPGTGVVLVGDPDVLSLDAMRAGVRDVLPPTTDVAALRTVLERVADSMRMRYAAPVVAGIEATTLETPGRVLSVLSPKGGAGKTTISTNLAVGLALADPGSVVLVDLDLQFGDVATALGLDPEYAIDDVVRAQAVRDPIALKTRLTQHSSGLSVLCAPATPAGADVVTPDQVAAVITALSRQFRHVVLDTAPGLDATTLAALDHTTDPLLLTTFDVPGARGLAKEMATLRELGMLTHARQVVLNFANPGNGLSVRDVEATIGSKVDLTIPHSKAATAAMNMGVPIMAGKPRDAVARRLATLVAYYREVDERRSSGRHRAAA